MSKPTTEKAVKREAVLSEDGSYRYSLTRVWARENGTAVFVMLNPSIADANEDDPTIRRCMGFARSWGLGGILVLNLYALRSTDPKALWSHEDPIGPDNFRYLTDALSAACFFGTPVVAAWGANAKPLRTEAFKSLARDRGVALQSLGTTKAGAPRHPLYIKGDTELRAWPGARP